MLMSCMNSKCQAEADGPTGVLRNAHWKLAVFIKALTPFLLVTSIKSEDDTDYEGRVTGLKGTLLRQTSFLQTMLLGCCCCNVP